MDRTIPENEEFLQKLNTHFNGINDHKSEFDGDCVAFYTYTPLGGVSTTEKINVCAITDGMPIWRITKTINR